MLLWLGASAAVAAAFVPVNLGLTAGTLYAAGDVATKAAVHRPPFVPIVLAAHGAAFVALQLGFQRGSPLATAGTSTLLTNALPILAGIAIFGEQPPGGAVGALRVRRVRVRRRRRRAADASANRHHALRDLGDGAGLA